MAAEIVPITPEDSAEPVPGAPKPAQEPPPQLVSRYRSAETVRLVADRLDIGDLREPALMLEDMLRNPRLRAVNETRQAGFIGTELRWEPGANNALGRRAAKAIEEDWPLIASDATRRQMAEWGINLGVCFLQMHWYVSPETGRKIPRLQVYHPQWFRWHAHERVYRGQAYGSAEPIIVPSPSMRPPTYDRLAGWVVHEPYGTHSFRRGLLRSACESALGHNWANRDESRASEKLGVGMLKAKFPRLANAKTDQGAQEFKRSLRTVGSEAIIACEQAGIGPNGEPIPGYDVEPLEFSGAGGELIKRTKDSKAVDLAILYLGHNLTTEAKGGSYAAANVGDLIRGDIKAADAKAEKSTMLEQVLRYWALANFGDPSVAPKAIYETDAPAVNEVAARTTETAARGALAWSKFEGVDLAAYCRRFSVPLLPGAEVRLRGLAPTVSPAGASEGAASAAKPEESQAGAALANSEPDAREARIELDLTPSDVAAIASVDEGRRSRGLPPRGGEVGNRWIVEHAARVKAAAAPAIAAAAAAESGQDPDAPPDPAPTEEE